GYTPPGWWSVVPEYLVDVRVLTHPADPEGTVSYEYLQPAIHLEEAVFASVAGESEITARLNAESFASLPLVYERRPTGRVPGRNVLFADGHVEWMREQEFQVLLREWGGN